MEQKVKPENMSWQEWFDPIKKGKITICEGGQCIETSESRQIGPGLFEHLTDGRIHAYDPSATFTEVKEPELTEEEIERCEQLGRKFGYDEVGIENIKNTTRQLKGSKVVERNTIDDIAKMMAEEWYDVKPIPEREVTLMVNQEGLDLFNQAAKKEFGKWSPQGPIK